jgi:hypothetical protein
MAPIADLGSFLRTRRATLTPAAAGLAGTCGSSPPTIPMPRRSPSADNPDLRLVVYTAEPGSPSPTALELLAHA